MIPKAAVALPFVSFFASDPGLMQLCTNSRHSSKKNISVSLLSVFVAQTGFWTLIPISLKPGLTWMKKSVSTVWHSELEILLINYGVRFTLKEKERISDSLGFI